MHYLQKQLDDFVGEIETLVHNHYKERFPSLELPEIGVDNGRKYWKAPQTKTKTAVRGYLTDEDRINTCTAYGIVYAR